VTDREAVRGFDLCARWEGILPALETAHAFGYLVKHVRRFTADDVVVVNVSGRGDKDVQQIAEWKASQAASRGKGR
jgi:tryptophan synthase beta chain